VGKSSTCEPSEKAPYTASATTSSISPSTLVTVARAGPVMASCSRVSPTSIALLSIP
jgi:hypothetical protein